MSNTATVEPNSIPKEKKESKWFSKPLFLQSLKSNWLLWVMLTVGTALIFIIINLVVGTSKIFTNINMDSVTAYVKDENLSWLQVLGLLEQMGFSLNRIQTMSQLDMNSIMNDLVYKIAGVLLPMIYVMIVANKLIAAQVSDGSMAYVLSTPTNRKKVLFTQWAFLILSLLAMYIVITICALGSEGIANLVLKNKGTTDIPPVSYRILRTSLYCFGSFAGMFALSGVCFGASGWFNKSSQSIGVGGGACVFAFLCCILGLFGSPVFVSVGVGVKAMNFFNYLTIYTLIDTDSMNACCKAATGYGDVLTSYDWLWKLAILFVIGFVLTFVGCRKFVKKDLPL